MVIKIEAIDVQLEARCST